MRWLLNGLLAATLPLTPPGAGTSPLCVARTSAPTAGLAVSAVKPLTNQRATEFTFTSRAMQGNVHAAVMLPASYAANRTRRYPVLYLLHGHGGHHLNWVADVEQVVGNTDVIVVMPEGGYDGFYSDWYGVDVDGHTPAPAPAWETFHIRELLPWVDATFRTTNHRSHRAVAGLSMGGFGAMSYAARHPDLFVAAGAFSGVVHPLLLWPAAPLIETLAFNASDGKPPDNCIWGDAFTQYPRWADHDPTELAANLRSVAVYHRSGDGTSGKYDKAAVPTELSPTLNEFGVGLMNQAFDRALTNAGVAHTAVLEHGIHTWPYWVDGLRDFLPRAMRAFASPPKAPPVVPFTYTSSARRFSVWGWQFSAAHGDGAELSTVANAWYRGLTAIGSGRVHVDTPALYRPNAIYTVNGARVLADRAGRLHFSVLASRDGTKVAITRAN